MQFERKSNKRRNRIIFISVLAAVLVILTVIAVFLMRRASNPEVPPEEEKVLIPILSEEGRWNTYPLAYPQISEKSINIITIENEKGAYFMAIPASSATDSFEFYYDFDEEGKTVSYYPDILTYEDGMLYDDFYATVKGDGYDRIPMLTYLVSALRTPYFDYRVYLDSDPAKREAQLKTYGLSSESGAAPADGDDAPTKKIVQFSYKKEDGTFGAYQIEIGAHTLTGSGYYFRISDGVYTGTDNASDGKLEVAFDFTPREYIYVTRESNHFKYALLGVEAYINPTLVASGLDDDQHALYAPYLTPDYRQWKTELHELGKLPAFESAGDENNMKNVTEIFADIDLYTPSVTEIDGSGFAVSHDKLTSYVFSLTEVKDNKLYEYLLRALANKELDPEKNDGTSIVNQVLLSERTVAEGVRYRYDISDVYAIITPSGERTDSAPANVENGEQYVRVTYTLQVFDENENAFVPVKNVTVPVTDEKGNVTGYEQVSAKTQGVLDLVYLEKIGVDAATLTDLKVVGDSSAKIEVTYDKKINANLNRPETMSYFLDAVLEIYETERDAEGNITSFKRTTTVTDTSLVVYRYYYMTGDKKTQSAQIGFIDMKSDPKEESHEKKDKIRLAVKGWMSEESEIAFEVLKEVIYDDVMSDFLLFSFKKITAYVTGEIVSAFKFVNASERDPFYGESFYERGGDEEESNFMSYAMSQDACEKVVKLLGGIAETSGVEGLAGKETVKVGITTESLEYYIFRLGKEGGEINPAYTIRFSLPRELYVSNETAEDEYDDYGWLRTLDFVLHISKPVYDDESKSWIRYVASEMYNIIVKIDADVIGFVDLETVDFWARRDMMLIDTKYIKNMEVEFNMSNLSGRYNFSLKHTPYRPPNAATDYDWIDVYVTNLGSSFTTEFDKYAASPDCEEKFPTLEGFYNWLAGEIVKEDSDSKGTGMFKEVLRLLYFTKYMGTLTEEEQQSALKNENGEYNDPLMAINIKLDESHENVKKGKTYVYEFFRVDDRRIMVRISERYENVPGAQNSASDFYITSLAFEKIVMNFIGLLNGEDLDANDPYPDFTMPTT